MWGAKDRRRREYNLGGPGMHPPGNVTIVSLPNAISSILRGVFRRNTPFLLSLCLCVLFLICVIN